MRQVHVVILWHMHQPQYRDPSTGVYLLPWTRLHALKDYWGMVKILGEFPGVRMTFNVVPALALQLQEYAGGNFREPWFEAAFTPAGELTPAQRGEILERAFQLNHENLLRRWPRFRELYDRVRASEREAVIAHFGLPDWRDLQLLSQLAWMDEEYLAHDPVVSALARQGSEFEEEDKQQLRAKQLELLARVLPEYRAACDRGQIEISTTPFYHPILPLLCDTDIARIANPHTPLPQPPFRYPGDAREQLQRARAFHQNLFGQPPAGVWPSEGSVSDAALQIAAELGFAWFATDEGVLGRTRGIGFSRDARGYPENAAELYAPHNLSLGRQGITGLYRDHYLSDLIGFVYSRMDAEAAAADLHGRLRAIGERWSGNAPATVSLILDGENAWEHYPGNGRDFLRRFYGRIQSDPDIRALTVSEAIAAAGELKTLPGTAPGSWINANFDIWIGDAEDVLAWDLLRDARDFYEVQSQLGAAGVANAPTSQQLATAFDSVLAAEGSDWCWWFGPENSTANDADFDALYRKHLTATYLTLGHAAPDALAQPIKRPAARARSLPPSSYLHVQVDGRETSYFEWLGAGIYVPDRRSMAMHGRSYFLGDLHFGFSEQCFYVRVDWLPSALERLKNCELRLTLRDRDESRIIVRIAEGALAGQAIEKEGHSPMDPAEYLSVGLGKILEMGISKELFHLQDCGSFKIAVALWQAGLPVDLSPREGFLEIHLGHEFFAWPRQT